MAVCVLNVSVLGGLPIYSQSVCAAVIVIIATDKFNGKACATTQNFSKKESKVASRSVSSYFS